MKRTAACHDRLRRLFEEGFGALDVAEPLKHFSAERPAVEVRELLQSDGHAVAGVLRDGALLGYVRCEDLDEGLLQAHLRPFRDRRILDDNAPLSAVIRAVHQAGYCFVRILGQPAAVVAKPDLEKAPMRMWLFGMITMLEAALTEAVQHFFPDEAWTEQMPAGRLEKAQALRSERVRRQQEADLLDCLQMADKVMVLMKDADVRRQMGVESRRETEASFKQIQSLRNNLAHGQPFVTHDWVAVVSLTESLEGILGLVPPADEAG